MYELRDRYIHVHILCVFDVLINILHSVERSESLKKREESNALWHFEKRRSALPCLLATAWALSSIAGHFSAATLGITAHILSTFTACRNMLYNLEGTEVHMYYTFRHLCAWLPVNVPP